MHPQVSELMKTTDIAKITEELERLKFSYECLNRAYRARTQEVSNLLHENQVLTYKVKYYEQRS